MNRQICVLVSRTAAAPQGGRRVRPSLLCVVAIVVMFVMAAATTLADEGSSDDRRPHATSMNVYQDWFGLGERELDGAPRLWFGAPHSLEVWKNEEEFSEGGIVKRPVAEYDDPWSLYNGPGINQSLKWEYAAGEYTLSGRASYRIAFFRGSGVASEWPGPWPVGTVPLGRAHFSNIMLNRDAPTRSIKALVKAFGRCYFPAATDAYVTQVQGGFHEQTLDNKEVATPEASFEVRYVSVMGDSWEPLFPCALEQCAVTEVHLESLIQAVEVFQAALAAKKTEPGWFSSVIRETVGSGILGDVAEELGASGAISVEGAALLGAIQDVAPYIIEDIDGVEVSQEERWRRVGAQINRWNQMAMETAKAEAQLSREIAAKFNGSSGGGPPGSGSAGVGDVAPSGVSELSDVSGRGLPGDEKKLRERVGYGRKRVAYGQDKDGNPTVRYEGSDEWVRIDDLHGGSQSGLSVGAMQGAVEALGRVPKPSYFTTAGHASWVAGVSESEVGHAYFNILNSNVLYSAYLACMADPSRSAAQCGRTYAAHKMAAQTAVDLYNVKSGVYLEE